MAKHRFNKNTGASDSEVLSVLLEGLGEGVALADLSGKVTEASDSVEIITGREHTTVIGAKLTEVLGLLEGEDASSLQCQSADTWSQTLCRGRRADGAPLALRIRSRLYRDSNNRIAGSVHLFSEASLQDSIQRRLVAYQRLAGLGELSAALIHEVGNPVSVILGFAHLLVQQKGEDADGEIRERIYHEAMRCRQIVDRLLDYARSSSRAPTPAPISVKEVALEVLGLVSYRLKSKNIEATLDWDAQSPLVKADAGEMKQVLLNLLINAVDASPPSTVIELKGESIQKEVPVGGDSLLMPVATVQKEHWVRFTVADRGTGLGGADPERLFAPFYSTKEKGGGLGLSVCRRIAEGLGGSLKLAAREGGGAAAVMELPGHSPT